MNRPSLILAGAAALALAGCGKVGTLERPAPLWGAKAKAEYEAQQKAEAEARARERQQQGGSATAPQTLPGDVHGHSETNGSPATTPPPPPTPQ